MSLSLVLSILFLVAVLVAVYALVLRPVLRQRAAFRAAYGAADAFWARLWGNLAGLRTVLIGRLSWLAGVVVAAHESLAVMVQLYLPGIDWSPVTTLLFDRWQVPGELRPLIATIAGGLAVAAVGQVMVALRRISSGPAAE